jgi:magnesium transporter
MLRILHRAADKHLWEWNDPDAVMRIPELIAVPETLTWIDLTDDGSHGSDVLRRALEKLLCDLLHYHPLAVEDLLSEASTPRVDDWGEYLYVVLHAVRWDVALEQVDTAELDVFLGYNYLITYRSEPIPSVDKLWKALLRDERHTRRGSDYVLYEIADALATDYMPCMDAMDDALDRMEDEIFDRPSNLTLARIFKLKSAVLNLRRVLSPQREVMTRLARDEFAVIDVRERVYFRDVYDHLVRLVDINESLRDLVSGALETYLSVTANRTNDVMKTMTIFTMLFSPLAVITGFFGMNFFAESIVVQTVFGPNMLFGAMLTLMISVPVLLLVFIRRRGWV